MKIIINHINIYHIHDNRYYNNGNYNDLKVCYGKTDDTDIANGYSRIVVEDNLVDEDNPIIAQLKERVLQRETDLNALLDKLNNEETK